MPVDNLDNPASSETSDSEILSEESSVEEKVEEETKEVKSTEEELEEPTGEEEEEETEEEEKPEEETTEEDEITRPSWKEIKEKYPDLAKNKEFREVYFREKAFSDIFPTVEDAKDAGDKARVLEAFDDSLAEGDPAYLIKNLAPKSLTGFIDKVLPAIKDFDRRAYIRATGPVLIDVVNNIQDYAASKGDKNLEISVGNICKFLFGDFKVPNRVSPVSKDPEVEREKRSLQEEREQLLLSRKQEFTGKIERSLDRQLGKLVGDDLGIKNEFLSKQIVKETLAQVRATIGSDKEFLNRIKSMYAQAERSGYSPEHATRVISAYLGRAKGIALKARAELKTAALSKQSTKESDNPTKKVLGTEKGTKESSKRAIGTKVDLKSTREISDLEILNQP